MKVNKKVMGFVAAVLFSFGFTLLVKACQHVELWNISTVVFSITNLIIVLIVATTFQKIVKYNSGKTPTELKKSIVPSFLFFVVVTLFVSLSVFSAGVYLIYLMTGADSIGFREHFFKYEFFGAIKSVSGGILVGYTVFLYTFWRQSVDREQQLREENLTYKYRTLKTQVNPHFLFNSLNTLSEFIYTDTSKADQYIQKLSSVYRYILDNEETDTILLAKEIGFVEQYFDLLKERDGKKIQLDIKVNNKARSEIIPVSLQVLVENALKHNSRSEEDPLKIRIELKNDMIIVSNQIRRKSILKNSNRTGLVNLKERVRLITGKEMKIEEQNNQFVVQLPIIPVKL